MEKKEMERGGREYGGGGGGDGDMVRMMKK